MTTQSGAPDVFEITGFFFYRLAFRFVFSCSSCIGGLLPTRYNPNMASSVISASPPSVPSATTGTGMLESTASPRSENAFSDFSAVSPA